MKDNSRIKERVGMFVFLCWTLWMNAQKAIPFYVYSQNHQTLESGSLPQKIDFPGMESSSETSFVAYHSENATFRIKQQGHYKIQTGLAFRHQLVKNLSPLQSIECILQITDDQQNVLESVTYVVSRYAIPETVYIQTAKSIYFFGENNTFSVQITIRKGAKELGKGPHILTDETAPFSKFITVEKL